MADTSKTEDRVWRGLYLLVLIVIGLGVMTGLNKPRAYYSRTYSAAHFDDGSLWVYDLGSEGEPGRGWVEEIPPRK